MGVCGDKTLASLSMSRVLLFVNSNTSQERRWSGMNVLDGGKRNYTSLITFTVSMYTSDVLE